MFSLRRGWGRSIQRNVLLTRAGLFCKLARVALRDSEKVASEVMMQCFFGPYRGHIYQPWMQKVFNLRQ